MLSQIILSKLPNLLKSSTVFFVGLCCLVNIDMHAKAQPVVLENMTREKSYSRFVEGSRFVKGICLPALQSRTENQLTTSRNDVPVRVCGPKNISGKPSYELFYADGTKRVVPVSSN